MKKEILNSLIEKKYTQRKIAEELGVSHTSIRYWLKKLNLKTKSESKNRIRVINGYKNCTKCNVNKPISEFYKRTNKKTCASKCKKCANTYYGNRVKIVKIKMIEYKGSQCEKCKLKLKDTHYAVFDFHHLDPKAKDIKFDRIKYQSWEKIQKEIDKCLLLCANCHRLEHAKIGGY